jgi:hypothetical protein
MDFTCARCDKKGDESTIVFCTGCNYEQCLPCWNTEVPHKKGIPGISGFPHDKINPAMVAALRDCLREPNTEQEQDQNHIDDEDTTWFGLDREDSGDPILAEYGRYATIMLQTTIDTGQERYPQLVSFVGETSQAFWFLLLRAYTDAYLCRCWEKHFDQTSSSFEAHICHGHSRRH